MKKIYCDLKMFNLFQDIYIIDSLTGEKEKIITIPMEKVAETISLISNEKNISKIILTGKCDFNNAIADSIISHSKIFYKKDNIEVEVLK